MLNCSCRTEPMSYSDPSWNCGSLDRKTNTTVSCGTVLAVRELEGNRAHAAMYRNMIRLIMQPGAVRKSQWPLDVLSVRCRQTAGRGNAECRLQTAFLLSQACRHLVDSEGVMGRAHRPGRSSQRASARSPEGPEGLVPFIRDVALAGAKLARCSRSKCSTVHAQVHMRAKVGFHHRLGT